MRLPDPASHTTPPGDREGRPYGPVLIVWPLRKVRPYNPPVGSADSPLYTRGLLEGSRFRIWRGADAVSQS